MISRKKNKGIKDNLYEVVRYTSAIFTLFLLFFLVSTMYALAYIDCEIRDMLDKHFAEVKNEGYITESIRKSIINDADDILGMLKYDVSGTTERVKEGEMVYLEFKVYPIARFKNFYIKYALNGKHKSLLHTNLKHVCFEGGISNE